MFDPSHITFNVTTPGSDEKATGKATVGWFLTSPKGAVLFDPPSRVHTRARDSKHAKSATRCPAVTQLESRYFSVPCPYDLHIGFGRDKDGRAVLLNRAGDSGALRSNFLSKVLMLVNETEWRFANRPTVQLILPYCFIADEPVYLSQIAPFLHYRADPIPGTIFGGRFPIHIWPRALMWAFEWHDIEKDLILRRGEPLFYLTFETEDPARPLSVVEAELTAELSAYMESVSGVVNYVNQTFSLFEAAEKLRPPTLLSPKARP